eukprot:1195895-Prorocentrum_minimum.AAC.2
MTAPTAVEDTSMLLAATDIAPNAGSVSMYSSAPCGEGHEGVRRGFIEQFISVYICLHTYRERGHVHLRVGAHRRPPDVDAGGLCGDGALAVVRGDLTHRGGENPSRERSEGV